MALDIMEILYYQFGSNLVADYLFALAVFVSLSIVLRIFKSVVILRLKMVAERTKTEIDNLIISVVDSIKWPFYLLVSAFVSLGFLSVPTIVDTILYYSIFIVAAYYGVKIVQTIIDYGSGRLMEERRKDDEDTSVIDILTRILKIGVWVVGLLFVLSNFGFNITPMIAGLGIGGVAIAFALQNILGDIFASFSIYFDKPFQKGDFIIIGNDMGVVEKIGIKSTRIRTLQGQELIVSNKDLTETRVHNYKRMQKRRIVFNLGVKYETPTEKLKKIPVIIKDIIDKIESVELDRVHFNKFGDFSLGFEVVYNLNTSDYNKYMDVQQEINLMIKEQFEAVGIEMAYPTQTVYINKTGDA
ncbi:MAG: mechanosensitive ion channel family protein [Candidatus Aenigmarchaeota archaeon]|nr:mechanosensitive ion channel family protein [Candidatus Aenigmarchaeota archaeon]